VSIITVGGSETTSNFLNSILFDGKLNLVGAFGTSKAAGKTAYKLRKNCNF